MWVGSYNVGGVFTMNRASLWSILLFLSFCQFPLPGPHGVWVTEVARVNRFLIKHYIMSLLSAYRLVDKLQKAMIFHYASFKLDLQYSCHSC